MNEIFISRETPREKGTFDQIRVSKGIEKYFIIAAGLMFLGIMSIGAIFFPPYELGLSIFQAIMGGLLIIVGTFLVLVNNLRVKSRKKALLLGEIVEGTVIDHGRQFNPTSSKKYYTVTIKYRSKNGDETTTIKSSSDSIFENLPLQSTTLGILADLPKYKVFFPAEVDVKISIKE